jgi:hypothetical protein
VCLSDPVVFQAGDHAVFPLFFFLFFLGDPTASWSKETEIEQSHKLVHNINVKYVNQMYLS